MTFQIFPADWEPYVRNQIMSMYKDIIWSHYYTSRAQEHWFMMTGMYFLIGGIVVIKIWWIAVGVCLVIPLSFWWRAYRMHNIASWYERVLKEIPHTDEIEEAVRYFAMNPQEQDVIRAFLQALTMTSHASIDDARLYCNDIINVLARFQNTPFIKDSPCFLLLVKMLTTFPGMPRSTYFSSMYGGGVFI